jgi:apolipoprotein D and lipocalin family protein
VPYVNLTRYVGLWYEQASIPAPFATDCESSTANYSFNEDGSIKVVNTCFFKGESRSLEGRAVPDPADTEQTNAKLKVKFPMSPVAGDYWVVRLDDSYSYAVVGGPTYTFLWILYRSPIMPKDSYDALIEDLRKDGFPVDKLRRDYRSC